MTQIAIVSAGLREPSSTRLLADQLSTALTARLQGDGEQATSAVIDLRMLGRSIMDATLTGFVAKDLEVAFTAIHDADALVAVTPAFNASFSGLFKMFFDVLPEGTLTDMPVLIGATGGTERHSLVLDFALRPMFSYLHAIVSPTGVYAATGDFGTSNSHASLHVRISKAADDFTRLLRSRGAHSPRDVFAESLDEMEHLLGSNGS